MTLVPDQAPDVWLQTLPPVGSRVGVCFDLFDPRPEMVDWNTVATVSARVPRFAGHTGSGVLSVAQHEVEGAKAILRDTGSAYAAGAFLIHDAHEHIIGDIATPVVEAIAAHSTMPHLVKQAVASLKARLDHAIYTAAGYEWPLPPDVAALVKLYDRRMLVTEHLARMAPAPYPWANPAEAIEGCDLYPWPEAMTRSIYRRMMLDLLPAFAGNAVDSTV